jgi:hypothetical protein
MCSRIYTPEDLEACRHTTYFVEEIGDEVLLSQIRKFFVRLHPFLETENLHIRSIFKQFLTKPELFDSIPDFLQCIQTLSGIVTLINLFQTWRLPRPDKMDP